MSTYGFVYVMSNSVMPGIYKIGMTMRSPHGRAAELSASTGVPAPFTVAYYMECENPAVVENELHERFSDYRVSRNREFFSIELFDVIDACSDYCITDWLSNEARIAVHRATTFQAIGTGVSREVLQ